MRIALLGSTESWYAQDLQRAAGSDHEITPITFRDLHSSLGVNEIGIHSGKFNLRDVDAVLVRTMPAGSLEQIVFRMDALDQLEGSSIAVVNPAKAIETAVDKYLATARLERAGLTVPRTICCQTVDDAMEAFQLLDSNVVCKPLFGAEGRGIVRLTDEEIAWRAFKLFEQSNAVIYLQEFIPHEGKDLRLFVLGEEVLGISRSNPGDWRTNVSRGAQTAPLEVTAGLADIARRATNAVGALVAGVDVLPGRDGKLYVLEVNAVPGWRALARTLNIDVAQRVLDYVCQLV